MLLAFWSSLLALLVGCARASVADAYADDAAAAAANRTDLVSWDHFSLSINGTRIFLQSGEFHYQRLPVPELWPVRVGRVDIPFSTPSMLTSPSIYFFWSYHSAAPGVFDFDSPGKNVQRVFDAAKEAGLWVIARPGPYSNAETTAGGLPLWGSDGSLGKVRTSDETYHKAWQPWVAAIGKLIAKNQITNGGPVILSQVENELQESHHTAGDTLVVYMQQLEAAFRAAGVTVPFLSNEKGMRSQSWSSDYENVGGAVDVYGLDSYPGSLSCTNPAAGFRVARSYHQWFARYAGSQPVSLPEFEGGWFSAWGSSTFYDQCVSEHSPEFADVYYKNNIGQRTTFQNLYMAYGGTNWGHSAAPVVYTSYDYSAPIRETRQQTMKLFQTKLVNLFATSSPDLLKTVMVGNGTGFRVSSQDIYSWVLQNPDSKATFTVIQQSNTPSTANVTTSVSLDTTSGTIIVPDVALYGRQSKILVTDYALAGGAGKNTLLYSTADIATSVSFGDVDALVLYLKAGQTGEIAFRSADSNVTFTAYGSSHVTSTTRTLSSSSAKTYQAFTYMQGSGATAVHFSNGVVVYLLDQPTAWRLWVPQNGGNSLQVEQPKNRLLIFGPYLVRSAAVDWAGGVLRVQGDSDAATVLEAFVGSGNSGSSNDAIHTIEWNGRPLPATQTAYGAFRATIPGGQDRIKDIHLPSLQNGTGGGGIQWYAADSLPEARPEYDDSRWSVCNKTTTRSPVAPITLPILFSSDYGFYAGIKVYRGRFPTKGSGGGSPTGVNITASGGAGFGWTAWLNGHLIGGNPGAAGQATTSGVLSLPAATLVQGDKENVLTVLVDYHGHDETSVRNGLANPRGLLGAKLLYGGARAGGGGAGGGDGGGDEGGNDARVVIERSRDAASADQAAPSSGFTSWRLAGNAGGSANPDPVRGPLNEGGLYGERLGWHLPGFNPMTDKAFQPGSSPAEGIGGAGVRFYVTTFGFGLNGTGGLPPDLDVPLGIELGAPAGTVARVQLWVNGYQYGKYVPHLGPQTRFPVPPGVLNTGPGETNTLALSLWAMTAAGARLDRVALVGYGEGAADSDGGVAAYETSFFAATDSEAGKKSSIDALQPRWKDRSQYA